MDKGAKWLAIGEVKEGNLIRIMGRTSQRDLAERNLAALRKNPTLGTLSVVEIIPEPEMAKLMPATNNVGDMLTSAALQEFSTDPKGLENAMKVFKTLGLVPDYVAPK